MTEFRHAGVLYLAVLKYVSLSLTVAWVMWFSVAQTEARPSHPFLP